MRADRAGRDGITDIRDLAALEGGVRMAVPQDYAARPGDGLYALSRRYGLALASGEPLVIDDAGDRVAAVLQGQADAAVFRDFGYDLGELGLLRLTDSLEFFTPYQATLLVGPAASAASDWLQGALSPLMGRVTSPDMRQMMQGDTLPTKAGAERCSASGSRAAETITPPVP